MDECEYLRLIETASNTPHNSTAESGYACASVASSHSSSTDGPYFDAASTSTAAAAQDPKLPASDLKEYANTLQLNGSHELVNGVPEEPHPSQDVVLEDEAFLQAQILSELQQHSISFRSVDEAKPDEENLTNGHIGDEVEQLELKNVTEVLDVAGTTNRAPGVSSSERVLKEVLTNRVQESLSTEGTQEDTCDRVQQESCLERVQGESTNERVQEEAPLDKTTTETSIEAYATTATTATEDSIFADRTDVELSPDSGVDETDKSASNLTVNVDLAQIEQAKQDVEKAVEKSGAHSHGIDTTDDEDDCRPQRIRRCSSLKTGKTPPGTPGRKKIVRFADVLGLDLADVKTFLDEIPTIPKSAFEDLEILESEPPLQLGPKSDKLLMPLFQQPGGLATFLDAVREKQVSLENAAVSDNINQTISGSVRVRNLDFHKSVHIRYSLDGWRSYADLQANYVENSCDGFSDKFTFVLFGNSLHVGQRLEFAVRFQCKGQQFWDNNYGANYCFQCLPSSTHTAGSTTASPPSVATGPVTAGHSASLVGMLSPTAGDAWCSSFY